MAPQRGLASRATKLLGAEFRCAAPLRWLTAVARKRRESLFATVFAPPPSARSAEATGSRPAQQCCWKVRPAHFPALVATSTQRAGPPHTLHWLTSA